MADEEGYELEEYGGVCLGGRILGNINKITLLSRLPDLEHDHNEDVFPRVSGPEERPQWQCAPEVFGPGARPQRRCAFKVVGPGARPQ